MPNLEEISTWLHDRLPGLLAEHQVPGAAIAVSMGRDVIDLAAGVLSKATKVEATADAVFQVGSITKLWTSTLVMQLADEGKLDIDAPVRRYLPDFHPRCPIGPLMRTDRKSVATSSRPGRRTCIAPLATSLARQ